jgi:hypothetical protein
MRAGLRFGGITIGDAYHRNFSWTGWALHGHSLALAGLDQRTSHGRYPADAVSRQMGFVNPHDPIRLLITVFIFNCYVRTKKNLIIAGLGSRIDDLGHREPLRKESQATIDFTQSALAVNVISIL